MNVGFRDQKESFSPYDIPDESSHVLDQAGGRNSPVNG